MNSKERTFTEDAQKTLKMYHEKFISRLIHESREIATRSELNTISAIHVKHANRNLYQNGSPSLSRYLGTIGGILLGASLSNILAMASDEKYTTVSILLSVSMAIIGTFFIARHPAND
jgi:hypothetical protein